MASRYGPGRGTFTITCDSAGVVIRDTCGKEGGKAVTRVARVRKGGARVKYLQCRVPGPDRAPLPDPVIIIDPNCATG